MDISEVSSAHVTRKIQKQKAVDSTQKVEGELSLSDKKKVENWVEELKKMPDIRDIETLRAVPLNINRILAEKIATEII